MAAFTGTYTLPADQGRLRNDYDGLDAGTHQSMPGDGETVTFTVDGTTYEFTYSAAGGGTFTQVSGGKDWADFDTDVISQTGQMGPAPTNLGSFTAAQKHAAEQAIQGATLAGGDFIVYDGETYVWDATQSRWDPQDTKGTGAIPWPGADPYILDPAHGTKGAAAPGDVFPGEATIAHQNAQAAALLAGLGFVAAPQTAWLVGEKILISPSYHFHWDGAAWAPGDGTAVAPNPSTAATPAGFDHDVPADLTTLQGLGALGNAAAWTTGQSVTLGDGSKAYWSGTAWVAGTAPAPPTPTQPGGPMTQPAGQHPGAPQGGAGGQAAAATTATEWTHGGTTWQDPYGPIQEAKAGGWTKH